MEEIDRQEIEEDICITYEIKTAGLGEDERMLFQLDPCICGEIKDGIALTIPSLTKGWWVFSFDDLVQMYELAKQARKGKGEEIPELTHEERLLVVETLREKAANLEGFSGRVGSRKGAAALAQLEIHVKQMKDLADRFEANR